MTWKIFGAVFLVAFGIFQIFQKLKTGEASWAGAGRGGSMKIGGRGGRTFRRSEEPVRFWFALITQFGFCLLFAWIVLNAHVQS